MESNHIKEAVSKIQNIIATKDVNFSSNGSKAVGVSLLRHLASHFEDAPTTATAMVQYLADNGYKLSNLKGEAYDQFMECFSTKIAQFSPEQIDRLRKIAKKLMTN